MNTSGWGRKDLSISYKLSIFLDNKPHMIIINEHRNQRDKAINYNTRTLLKNPCNNVKNDGHQGINILKLIINCK